MFNSNYLFTMFYGIVKFLAPHACYMPHHSDSIFILTWICV